MKYTPDKNPTDLPDVPIRRVVYHALLAYIIPLSAFNRWAGLRTIGRVYAAHLKPVWIYRLEMVCEGRLYSLFRRIRRKLGL